MQKKLLKIGEAAASRASSLASPLRPRLVRRDWREQRRTPFTTEPQHIWFVIVHYFTTFWHNVQGVLSLHDLNFFSNFGKYFCFCLFSKFHRSLQTHKIQFIVKPQIYTSRKFVLKTKMVIIAIVLCIASL